MKNLSKNVAEKANLIWSVADKLTGLYKPHEYGKVILPLTVLKRFDSVLFDTKKSVLKEADSLPKTFAQRDFILKETASQSFYNTSKYDFKRLLDDPNNIESNLYTYINSFSDEVLKIMENFNFEQEIKKMADAHVLYSVIETFNEEKADLHPDKVSNIEMGYIFEELIRKFSESHNADAGQHYTPREIIELMVNIVLSEESDLADSSKIKTVYDGACGTGGMLSATMEYVYRLNSSSKILGYGQEYNQETYAICKADMLIKGEDASNIRLGDTLANDQFPIDKFDYIIMNPPFGREWKTSKDEVLKEASKGAEGRFPAGVPAISDSQLLFLQHAVSKMNPEGSKVAIIHNGSALFAGDAGSGPSEIRRYVIENDLLEAIIQLPNDIFYNTGIATYIWVLSNKKNKNRQGKVQLIDASKYFVKLRKSLGNKRHEMTRDQIDLITQMYGDFTENKNSKIFPNEYFGYEKVEILKPLLNPDETIVKSKAGKIEFDKDFKDTENIPLLTNKAEYLEKEVHPYIPGAVIDESKTKVGYEIPFTKIFYKFKPLPKTEDLKKELVEIEEELLKQMKDLL